MLQDLKQRRPPNKHKVKKYSKFYFFIDDNMIRETTSGLVMGEKRQNSLNPNESYYAFHALPYAAPPTGSLRFKPPKAPIEWADIYNASDAGNYFCCPQVSRK